MTEDRKIGWIGWIGWIGLRALGPREAVDADALHAGVAHSAGTRWPFDKRMAS